MFWKKNTPMPWPELKKWRFELSMLNDHQRLGSRLSLALYKPLAWTDETLPIKNQHYIGFIWSWRMPRIRFAIIWQRK